MEPHPLRCWDIAVTFSTSSRVPYEAPPRLLEEKRVHDAKMNPILLAAVEATEEAIMDSLFAATTVVGRDGNTSRELSLPEVIEILDRYGRLSYSLHPLENVLRRR